MSFKPMLAATLEPSKVSEVTFPVMASPKLDGIRCIVLNGQAVTRSLKPIPNQHIRALLSCPELEGFDGELAVGPLTAPDLYNKTNSGVMSRSGEPDFCFHVFDKANLDPSAPFHERFNRVRQDLPLGPVLNVVEHTLLHNAEELLEYEAWATGLGYEGVMLRSLDGLYKRGRSTLKQGWLLKLKRFMDAEAVIIGYEELYSNQNEATINALGHTERSSHKANMVPMGVLGAVQCRTPEGVEFSIGSGFTMAERQHLWSIRDTLPGQLAKYKFFAVGVKVAPRFPTWKGLRSPLDL